LGTHFRDEKTSREGAKARRKTKNREQETTEMPEHPDSDAFLCVFAPSREFCSNSASCWGVGWEYPSEMRRPHAKAQKREGRRRIASRRQPRCRNTPTPTHSFASSREFCSNSASCRGVGWTHPSETRRPHAKAQRREGRRRIASRRRPRFRNTPTSMHSFASSRLRVSSVRIPPHAGELVGNALQRRDDLTPRRKGRRRGASRKRPTCRKYDLSVRAR